MPGFQHYDPDELRTSALVHHEGAHLILAYYYGFRISRFRFIWRKTEWGGAVRNQMNPAFEAANQLEARTAKARQLLVGEIAGRRDARIAMDRMVLGIPGAEQVNGATPLDAIIHAMRRAGETHRDAYRVFEIAQQLHVADWWPWFWGKHEEAAQLLDPHWRLVRWVAERLLVAKPYESAREKADGEWLNSIYAMPLVGWLVWPRGRGRVEGDELVHFCAKIRAPVRDVAYQSVSYVSD